MTEFCSNPPWLVRSALLGQAAANLAHDINGILHAIVLSQPPEPEATEVVASACELGATLCRQVLCLAGRLPSPMKKQNVCVLLRNLEPILRCVVRHRSSIALSVPRTAVPVMAPDGELERVVFNLVCNAAAATTSAGEILVAVRLSGSDWAEILVSDQGSGMSSGQIAFVEGTEESCRNVSEGIGLALVRDSVRAMGGVLRIQTEEGRGTTVRMRLRIASEGSAGEMGDGL